MCFDLAELYVKTRAYRKAEPLRVFLARDISNHLFLEQAEGYVIALEKSTCPLSTSAERLSKCKEAKGCFECLGFVTKWSNR